MNGTKATKTFSISEAAAHGACPVCAVLRQSQTRLVEETGVPAAKHLCNHHAWALAKAAPAFIAADLLLRSVRTRRNEGSQAVRTRCDYCRSLLQEETDKLKELATKMQTPVFLEWMRVQGTLCMHHAEKLGEQLPPEGRKVIDDMLSRTWEELERGLVNYAQHARRGEHAGGGVLGRAAEFLVCQRGIPGEETPC